MAVGTELQQQGNRLRFTRHIQSDLHSLRLQLLAQMQYEINHQMFALSFLVSWYLLLTMFIVVLVSWLVIVEFINPVCCIPKQNCDSNELFSGLCPSPTFSWLAKTAFLWSMLAYCLCCGSAVHQRSDRLRVGGAQPVRLPAVGEPKDHSWHHAVRGPLLSGHLPQLPTGRLLRP